MLKDPLTIFKFGYQWMFKQPSKENFAKVILEMFRETESLLHEFLTKENLSKHHVGYRPDSKIALLQNNNDYTVY